MTVLDDILEASTDSHVPVADLLRKVQIAATRLGASDIAQWARNELSGYAPEASLPPYREFASIVMGLFTGPMNSRIIQNLTPGGGVEDLWEVELRQPLVELQSLADSTGDGDPQIQWSAYNVQRYAQSGAFRIEFHFLFSAWNVLTKQSLHGLIDIVRTRAMEFALELQTTFPDAGSLNGPTVLTTPALASVVYNITNNITGHGTNIATGDSAHQASNVVVGDESALRLGLDRLGMSELDQDDFVEAIQADQGVDGPRTQSFLARLRSGSIQLGTGIAVEVAAESLVALARAFLGV
jgi:hypothetical protein